jgi:hypothetical protein
MCERCQWYKIRASLESIYWKKCKRPSGSMDKAVYKTTKENVD